jgi:hemolysin III
MDFHQPVSSGTHLFMAAWALFATLMLVRLSNGQPRVVRWSVLAFGLSMVLLYLASGFYHGLRYLTEEDQQFWLRMDRSAIFLLILGSMLPIYAAFLKGRMQFLSMAVMITIAMTGIIVQWTGNVSQLTAILSYVGMAAVGSLTIPWWANQAGRDGMRWFGTAIGLYGLGAVIEGAKWPVPLPGVVGHHELLHVCDMFGTLVHFGFVTRFVLKPVTATAGSYDGRIESISYGPPECYPAATTSATT